MALAIAAILFGGFVLDVVLGRLMGAAFLTDIQELLVLLAASVAFTFAILRREAISKTDKNAQQGGAHDP